MPCNADGILCSTTQQDGLFLYTCVFCFDDLNFFDMQRCLGKNTVNSASKPGQLPYDGFDPLSNCF